MNFGPARWVMEKTMGVTSEREFPAFATETFREWWAARGGAETSRERARRACVERGVAAADGGDRVSDEDPTDRKIAYFHGCYANYNTPEVGKALVRVFEQFGYEVVVPEQGCSGTPMFANGMLDDARRHAETTVPPLSALVEEGYDAVCSCTSCSMALRQGVSRTVRLRRRGRSRGQHLRGGRVPPDQRGSFRALSGVEVEYPDLSYHAPCHARNQGLHRQAVELFRDLEGVTVTDVGDSCSGISGTYGWKDDRYDVSMAIGEEMFEHMEAAEGTTGLTECPTCAMQMEHGTGYEIRHLQVLETALVDA